MKKILINNLLGKGFKACPERGRRGSRFQGAEAEIKKVLRKEGEPGIVSITFCDDKLIHKLNKQYRKKDCATDVLSFKMGEDNLLGDVIISVETAKRQAKEYGCSLEQELNRLALHGTWHLLGYTHKEMEMKELEGNN